VLWTCATGVACGSESGIAPEVEVTPIQIESVDVLVQETSPPRAAAHVRGVIGDGCSELHSVEQERSGDVVTLTILRERPIDAVCTQIARLYDETIPLEGTFPPGQYVLRVNSTETPFTTE
jgi:hypothetical protein